MRSLFVKKDRLSFYFIILLAVVACKKEGSVDDQNENLHAVQFKISGFTSESIVLKSSSPPIGTQSANPVSNFVEGYLYFWSFNDESLAPDIAYQTLKEPEIVSDGIPSYVGGYGFDGYGAGRALSFKGASEVLIKMSIEGAEQITQFAFDTGSSDTGPKDFEIYYSINEGETYEVLSIANQFVKTGDNAPKNSYTYALSEKSISRSMLWFKLIPKAGDRREGGSEYKQLTGTWRFDNIRLVGMSSSSGGGGEIDKLHYYLFHKSKPEVVVTGTIKYEEALSLKLALPEGKYSICFVSNASNRDLILPSNPTLSNFYVGNQFSNSNADIFGYYGELEVNGETDHEVKLRRLFSQIKLEFTDAVDLSVISKIGISQRHDPFFYAPFNPQLVNPILDQTDIDTTADFNTNKQLVFNQFMGVQSKEVSVKYTVVVYSSSAVLRTFHLESTLRNNMQLVFRGNLLDQSNSNGKFQVSKQMDWDGQKEGEF
ncbi:FimB/Mfa2 family fimbrial subunit [Sphingobacterium tabacisoli]|uniref:FimB/Mfa2 family fimbrial subunit n=1 Tax=Sphingobacterium tabacisoli TaxID=2044855 RepID=A0ABW5KV25_9SPHI|nr:FimB/Mfa2 family fimbrial subunit [Sphingobacterium tabacisoli]